MSPTFFLFVLRRVWVGTRGDGGGGGGGDYFYFGRPRATNTVVDPARLASSLRPFFLAPLLSVRETVGVVLPPHQLTVLVLARVPVPDLKPLGDVDMIRQAMHAGLVGEMSLLLRGSWLLWRVVGSPFLPCMLDLEELVCLQGERGIFSGR